MIDYAIGKMTSPVGMIEFAVSETELLYLEFGQLNNFAWDIYQMNHLGKNVDMNPEIIFKVQIELNEYFMGIRKKFTVPIRLIGTKFQLSVWNMLLKIPYGKTRSYLDISRQINKPGAARAVGSANKKNPIPIIVPCHRVVHADNTIGGYSGGLDNKRFLLQHESISIKH